MKNNEKTAGNTYLFNPSPFFHNNEFQTGSYKDFPFFSLLIFIHFPHLLSAKPLVQNV